MTATQNSTVAANNRRSFYESSSRARLGARIRLPPIIQPNISNGRSRPAPIPDLIRFPVAHAGTRRTRHRQMEKRDDGVSVKQTALGLIKIVQRVAARRRREWGLRHSQLPSGFDERRGWIGTR